MLTQLTEAKTKIKSGKFKKAYSILKSIQLVEEYCRNADVLDLLSICQTKGVRTKLNDIWISKTDFKINSNRISSVGFTSDSKFVIIGFCDDFSIRIYDIKTGNERMRLKGHSGVVSSVCGSIDGRCIVSGSYYFKNLWFSHKNNIEEYDNSIRLWDLSDGKELDKIEGDSGIDFGCFAPDGNFFSTVDHYYSTIGFFDFNSGKIDSSCFSPNAGLLVYQKGFSEPIRLLDIYTGENYRSFGHAAAYTPICF